jgi:hypothetical protein
MNRNPTMVTAVTFVAGMLAAGGLVFAQSASTGHDVVMRVQGVSMLTLNNDSPLALTVRAPAGSAAPATGATDASKRLFYTVVAEAGRNRKIRVRLEGAAPRGTELRVQAIPATPGIGRPAAESITLSGAEQTLMSEIGSCATGRSQGDGVALRYSLVPVDPSRLVADSMAFGRVVYTIADD